MANPEGPARGGRAPRRSGSGRGGNQPRAVAVAEAAPGTEPRRPGPQYEYAYMEPSLEALRVLGLPARGPTPPLEGPAEVLEPVPPPPALPVYGPVDRADPSDLFLQEIRVLKPDETVDFVVRRPYTYPSGPFPAEPGRVPGYVDPRTAVCFNLAPGAASRCLRGGGYF